MPDEIIKVTMSKGNKRIIMSVMPDGEVKIETIGYSGKSCIEESKFLKEALGEEISRELTPAYFALAGKETIVKHLPLCG